MTDEDYAGDAAPRKRQLTTFRRLPPAVIVSLVDFFDVIGTMWVNAIRMLFLAPISVFALTLVVGARVGGAAFSAMGYFIGGPFRHCDNPPHRAVCVNRRLGPLSASLTSLVEFLRIDRHLVRVSAKPTTKCRTVADLMQDLEAVSRESTDARAPIAARPNWLARRRNRLSVT